MAGSKRKRNGGYQASIFSGRYKVSRNGKPYPVNVTKQFATRHEADRWLTQQAMHRAGNEVLFKSAKKPLADYLTQDWLPHVQERVRPNTYTSYQETCNVHLIPALGTVPLANLTTKHVDDFMSEKRKQRTRSGKPLSVTSVNYYRSVLGIALEQAVEWQPTGKNPVTKHTRLSDDGHIPGEKVWIAAQASTFLAYTAEHSSHHPLYLTAIMTGMRLGELLGLKWSDFDTKTPNMLQVKRTLHRRGAGFEFGPPKSKAGNRRVFLAAQCHGGAGHGEASTEAISDGVWRGV